MKYLLFVLALFLVGCAQLGETQVAETSTPKVMPPLFDSPRYTIAFLSEKQSNDIQRRISKSRCGQASDDMSGVSLMAGVNTRPSTAPSLYVEDGDHTDGSKWYVLKATSNPYLSLCGVRLIARDQGTEVYVIGLRRKNMERIAEAVDAGTLFCECEKLSQ